MLPILLVLTLPAWSGTALTPNVAPPSDMVGLAVDATARVCWYASGSSGSADVCWARPSATTLALYTTSAGTTAAAISVGAVTATSVNAGSGTIQTTGTMQAGVYQGRMWYVVNANPSEPVTCDASHTGTLVYVDDTNDGAAAQWCACMATNDSTYDWINLSSLLSPVACSFF